MSGDDDGGVLGLSNYTDEHRIAWFFDDDEGGTLGESTYTEKDLAKAKPEDRDHVLATLTAAKTEGVKRDQKGFHWEYEEQAKKALAVIKAVIKADTGAPWPEWAVKAKAAGWKEPKGWKP